MTFLTTWINQTDNHKQTHLLECLNNKTCPVKVIRNDKNTCLCTSDVCAQIKCNGSGKSSHLTINCKIEMVLVNHVDCSVFVVIDDLSYGPIRKYICTSCSRKMFSIEEIRLQGIVLSDWDTLTTVNLGERDDMKSHDSSEGVFDAFRDCSDSAYITAFSTMRKSVLYFCVTGNCKNLCIISKVHRSVSFLYATILCIGDCNGSATNGSRKTYENQEINRLSFLTTWINQTDNHKQTHLLECLNNKTCPVKVIRNDINTCLCTTDVCAKIECNGSGIGSHLSINCKIEMVLVNHVDCSVFVVMDDLSNGPIRKYISTSCSRKMFSIKEIRLQAIVLSDWNTLVTVNLGQRDDMKSHGGVFDAFRNCSDSADITAFSTVRKSVLYLCVTGNCHNLCIISKCKDGIQSNERNKEIAFVISGILVFVGTIGFLMGVKRSRHRKAKLQITREVSRQHHPHNSALSANINISEPPLSSGAQKVEEENVLESLELENIMSTRVTSTDCLVPNFTSRHNLDDVYNSYNVLEPNYG